MSGIQKKEILEFMKKHQNVAKKEVEMDMLIKIWDRLAVKLNGLYGAAKGGKKWMKVSSATSLSMNSLLKGKTCALTHEISVTVMGQHG